MARLLNEGLLRTITHAGDFSIHGAQVISGSLVGRFAKTTFNVTVIMSRLVTYTCHRNCCVPYCAIVSLNRLYISLRQTAEKNYGL